MSLPNDIVDSNGKQIIVRTSHRSKRKPTRVSASKMPSEMDTDMPVAANVLQQRVFLYMQLKKIENMPVVLYPLELHLHHVKNTLQKMTEHYTNETIIYQNEFDMDKPAFALGIIQDNIDDMNTFSDNPLIVTLYQRIPRHRKNQVIRVKKVRSDASDTQLESQVDVADDYPGEDGEEDEGYIEEHLEFLSQGYCDLLQLFQKKRFMSNINIILYPEYYHSLETATSQKTSPTLMWHMYSILPILKNVHFTNLIFITLESIYNATEELHNRAEQLGLSISIRATRPNVDFEYKVLPLCTFYGFGSQVINEQNLIVVWENIKRDMLDNRPFGISNNQMDTNMRINLHRLFRRLLKTQYVDFKLEEIDPSVDKALINNSLHRYILTNEMCQILESALVYHEYELLLQLYDETPTNVMYEGVINPSVFATPEVNACRFASALLPVQRKTRKTHRLTESPSFIEKPMFAIVNVCLFQPLTKRNEPLDAFNESPFKASNLRHCKPINVPNDPENLNDIVKELYRNFDEHIRELISFIVKNDVCSVEEKRNYFCCNLINLRNLLVKICGSDFNIRMPTKSNNEFREMLTHMYKELMERIEGLLNSCSWDGLSNCVLNKENDQVRIRRLLEEYHTMCITGECVLAKQLYNDLKEDCKNKMLFNFYVFLNAVENLNFEQASMYLVNQWEKNWEGDYFVSLLKLYVDYMVELKTEGEETELTKEAFSNMVEQLRIFAKHNNLDREAWILLYCIYEKRQYMPGMEFARWKYEDLYDVPSKTMPQIPRSLFETFLQEDIELSGKNIHIVKFYAAFKTFAQLGAYRFAETIFDEISIEFSHIQTYLVKTTLKMLQGEIDQHFVAQKFPTDNSAHGKMMRYYQAHVNGNVEYSRRRYDEAIKCFKDLLSIDPTDIHSLTVFNLSLMRLGRLSFERGEYELAMKTYELCVLNKTGKEKNFLANYCMGLSLYYLDRLEEAIVYFARSTESDIFIPDPWGYLATINLRLGRNKTALNCWKIAKIYPEIPLNNRIYIELEKIKYSTVCLLVEDDCKPK